ncbi:MAG: FAD-binding and (Fe-S)-binding domain-containing protein [Terriglobales bacterium]
MATATDAAQPPKPASLPAGSTALPASEKLKQELGQIVEPARVLTRPIELIAFASDASFYHLIPKAVVLAQSVAEIQALFRFSHQQRIPITFRTAGTSLSGQAVTDGILVEVARHWKQLSVEDNGKKVRVQPGLIGGYVNSILRPYGVKIGPDPASISTCMIGGILSNNSSGMCCGVSQNAYHTLDSLTFVLPSGTVIDTANVRADEEFRAKELRLADGLVVLKRQIETNLPLYNRIRAKYRTKNTTGYSLNAFIDFERPVDIFQHVLIGSEGTLAFIAEAVLNTVPDLPVKYTGLLLFPKLHDAAAAIVPLRDAGAAALEIMDRAALRSVEDQPGISPSIRKLPGEAAGLLVEFQAASEADRADLESVARYALEELKPLEAPLFTHQAAEQAALWKIRAGMFPSVGAVRKSGTTVIIEDVAFPIQHLADACVDLQKLFLRHGYDNGIIFGHAKDGNLHFVITPSLNDQKSVDQYARFIDDLAKLVVERYDGALKAEHGTGRNMAPFVETEWGGDAYRIMKRLKELVDPDSLLNPGVIINSDPKGHLADLKRMPVVEDEVDKCIECGYCESKCPSRNLTLTPRQRIVVRREMQRLKDAGGNGMSAALDAEFPYMALDTCAVDGLCATACPVSIDTGQLTKRFRRLRHSKSAQVRAVRYAKNFAKLERWMRLGLRLGHMVQSALGMGAMVAITRTIRSFAGEFPLWTADVPQPAGPRPATERANAQAIYFPTCISRVLGRAPGEAGEQSLMDVLVTLAHRAGVPLFIPADVEGVCCGVPFSSKGFDQAHDVLVNRTIEKFYQWSDGGKLPLVIDTTPCTYGIVTCRPQLTPENQKKFDSLKILDSAEFAHDQLLPKLKVMQKADSVALHPVCSATKLNLVPKLEAIARACSDKIVVPLSAGCCGFAGDRGFLFPELTASATQGEAAELKGTAQDGYYSSSRTCEIGMKRATGQVYVSYLYLLEQATRS